MRLSKTCVYSKNIRFSESRSYTTGLTTFKPVKPFNKTDSSNTEMQNVPKADNTAMPKSKIVFQTPLESPVNTLKNTVPDKESLTAASILISKEQSLLPLAAFNNQTSSLAQATSDSSAIKQFPIISIPSEDIASSFTCDLNEFNDFFVDTDNFYFPLFPPISHHNLTPSEAHYLDIFYYKTSKYIMPFSEVHKNPIRDSILSMMFDNKFLFFAIMAASAMTSYRMSNNSNDYNESIRYLSLSLNTLSTRLAQDIDFKTFSFEAVLTTVLLLCTDHTSSQNLGWRAHLRGAKDLLDRRVSLSNQSKFDSRMMAFCKVWFAALEIIASITSVRGGTIMGGFTNHGAFKDLGLLQLQDAGIILPNGFNLFLGYSTSCLWIFSELSRLLNISKTRNLSSDENKAIEKLILSIHRAKLTAFPESRFNQTIVTFNPDSDMVVHAEDVAPLEDIDWFCISHKAHCEAALLAVYTMLLKLPLTSPVVTFSLSVLMGLLACIPYKDFRGTMVHWPLLTAGIHATSLEQEKFVLDRLDLLFKNGVWSAEFSKTRVKERQKEFMRFQKNINEEEPDSVPF